jgi:hypothetical protein
MADGRSGISPWLVGLIGYGLYRRSARRRSDVRGRGPTKGERAAARRWVTDSVGREALQVDAGMFEPVEGDTERWVWVPVDGSATQQEQLETTLKEAADEAQVEAVPVVLLSLGTRRRVNAVDAYATGGRLGHLPTAAVLTWGEQLRQVHRAQAPAVAVRGRILRRHDGALRAEVLMPERFELAGNA